MITTHPTTATAADWSVIELPGVAARIAMASARVAETCANQVHYDRDDLVQEARIFAATNPDLVRAYVEAGNLDQLYVRLRDRLINTVKTEVAHASRTYSRDQLIADVPEGAW